MAEKAKKGFKLHWLFEMPKVIRKVIVPWARTETGKARLSYAGCVNYAKQKLYDKKGGLGILKEVSTFLMGVYNGSCNWLGLLLFSFAIIEYILISVALRVPSLFQNPIIAALPAVSKNHTMRTFDYLLGIYRDIFILGMLCTIIFLNKIAKNVPTRIRTPEFQEVIEKSENSIFGANIIWLPFKIIGLVFYIIFLPIAIILAPFSIEPGDGSGTKAKKSFSSGNNNSYDSGSSVSNPQPDLQDQLRDSNDRYGSGSYVSYVSKVIRDKLIADGRHPDE